MVTLNGKVVERPVRIEARLEVVFTYFTDPQKMLTWKRVEAELDPRPAVCTG